MVPSEVAFSVDGIGDFRFRMPRGSDNRAIRSDVVREIGVWGGAPQDAIGALALATFRRLCLEAPKGFEPDPVLDDAIEFATVAAPPPIVRVYDAWTKEVARFRPRTRQDGETAREGAGE